MFNLPDKTASMLRRDLAAARAAWVEAATTKAERELRHNSDFLEYTDHAGKVADFHALRHTFISRLVESGASVKVAQELARHSTPTLTIGRYAHAKLHDLSTALDNLPDAEPVSGEREAAAALATGTYGGHAGISRLTPPHIPQQSGHESTRLPAIRCDNAEPDCTIDRTREPLQNKGQCDIIRGDATACDIAPGGIRTPDRRIRSPKQTVTGGPRTSPNRVLDADKGLLAVWECAGIPVQRPGLCHHPCHRPRGGQVFARGGTLGP